MNITSSRFYRDVDEAERAGLEMAASRLAKPVRVEKSPIHLECTDVGTVEPPANVPKTNLGNPYALILGRVVGMHIRDDVPTGGLVDVAKVKPMACLSMKSIS